MHALISALIIILSICTISYAHNGVDHGDGGSHDSHAPKAIEKGILDGQDNITYFDAGSVIQWAGQKLKRKITDTNQLIYQYAGELKEADHVEPPAVDAATKNNYFELKIPGGEV